MTERTDLIAAVRKTIAVLKSAGYPAAPINRLSDAAKAAHWKAHDMTARAWEPRFGEAAVKAFKADHRALSVVLGDNKAKAIAAKATFDWTAVGSDFDAYLIDTSQANWREIFRPMMIGEMTVRGKTLSTQFGMEFDVANFFSGDWFSQYLLRFAQPINKTTSETISAMLQQAMLEGWSIPEMQGHLDTMFTQWMNGNVPPEEFEWYSQRMPPYRRELIARTETIRASNAGSQQIYTDWGVQKKEWISTRDDRTRTSPPGEFDHLAADGEIVAIDQPFTRTGAPLMYPGDPDGPIGDTANCRCTEAPVIE